MMCEKSGIRVISGFYDDDGAKILKSSPPHQKPKKKITPKKFNSIDIN